MDGAARSRSPRLNLRWDVAPIVGEKLTPGAPVASESESVMDVTQRAQKDRLRHKRRATRPPLAASSAADVGIGLRQRRLGSQAFRHANRLRIDLKVVDAAQ